jgi:apolipoprotein N-acyltransferase
VASQEVAASQLRAVETGRWLLQAAPTGFSGVIDHRGDVVERTGQRERAVIQRDVPLREGRTWASHLGRWAVSLVALLALGAAWALAVRSRPAR